MPGDKIIVAVGDIHTAESFPDSLACRERPGDSDAEVILRATCSSAPVRVLVAGRF